MDCSGFGGGFGVDRMGTAALTLRPGPWRAAHAALLAPAMAHDPTTTPATLQRLVERSAAVLVEVLQGRTLVGAAVLRVDYTDNGPEGVIIAGAGKLPGARLLRDVLPRLERQFIGVRWVRIHTAREGLERELINRHGYTRAEVVLRKVIGA